MHIVASPKVEPADLCDHTAALEGIALEFPDLVSLTLANWHLFGHRLEDQDELRAAVEGFLSKHAAARMEDYAHMQELVTILVDSTRKFHDGLVDQLNPILEQYGLDVQVRLTRMLHHDIMIRVECPPL